MHLNSTCRFIIDCFKTCKGWLFIQIVVAAYWAIDLSIRPYVLKILLDRIAYSDSQYAFTLLSGPAVIFFLLYIVFLVFSRLKGIAWMYTNASLKRFIGDRLMNCMMLHSTTFFQNNFAGNLGSKIKELMSGIPDLFKLVIGTFFRNFLALIVAIITICFVNYTFAILLSGWIFIFIMISVFFIKKIRRLSKEYSEMRAVTVGQMIDILVNNVNVRLFARSLFESVRLRAYLDRWYEREVAIRWCIIIMESLLSVSFLLYQAICLYLLIYGFQQGSISPGDFILILTIDLEVFRFLWSLAEDIGMLSELTGNILHGLSIILMPHEIKNTLHAKMLMVHKGEITFDKVSFGYQGSEKIFQQICVTIVSGQKVGLVGYSGSGKTTFSHLILRLFDTIDGTIAIDGQDITQVTQDSLHQNIGMIQQDPLLFHRSIMENIRYGNVEATDHEVINAAKRAHAHEFIMQFQSQYASLVGERGVKLSGGQRQRIAFARVILKNSPILILDEATSQLDSVTEQGIQESLWPMMQGKTTIVIAHRLSTLLQMDRILVFDQGKIVQDGTHQELLANYGLYKILWDTQISGFLPESR